jgi:outer membrane protein TolC
MLGDIFVNRNKSEGISIDDPKENQKIYEDYLAAVTLAYLEWHESYENLEIAKSSYQENLKLLDNIREREKSKIALPLDVNKISLQVTAKREKLIDLEELYFQNTNIIHRMIRRDDDIVLAPVRADITMDSAHDFDEEFPAIRSAARTYQVLDLLREKSSVELERAADDLLPSIHLMVAYDIQGNDFSIERKERTLYAGVSAEWPILDAVNRAEYEVAKINQKRADLSIGNVHYRLYTQLKNLYREIQKERQLTAIAEEKISLATAVLKDETENYQYGKTLLNDYIQAVNVLDDNRFNLISHQSRETKLIVEFRRLADRLVSVQDIENRHPDYSPGKIR